MKLLFHCADRKVDVLDPVNYDKKAIYLSGDSFISALGQWLYIFDRDELLKSFPSMRTVRTRGMDAAVMRCVDPIGVVCYLFRSDPLGVEYVIDEPVDVGKHAVGVACNFNMCKGMLETWLQNYALNDGVLMAKQKVDLAEQHQGTRHNPWIART